MIMEGQTFLLNILTSMEVRQGIELIKINNITPNPFSNFAEIYLSIVEDSQHEIENYNIAGQ